MNRHKHSIALAFSLVALAGCDRSKPTEGAAKGAAAVKEAGATTITAGLDQKGRYLSLAKAAGIDATLAGPGPYTVFVPNEAAIGKLPAGTVEEWLKPENRAQLTRTLSNQILPGTVLAEDIGKAIEQSKGKAQLATVGGGVLTATREGGNIVLTDAAGGKAVIVKADETRANGVVHQTDAVLMPAKA